ncbi:MAG: CapA family protein, partial [Eggerthellaceae bacterium]|nr:CapA family protein [Eggerthellaceae bacterium]
QRRQQQQRQQSGRRQDRAAAFAIPMSRTTLAIGAAVLLAVLVLLAFIMGPLGVGNDAAGRASGGSADDAAQEAQEPKSYSVSFTTTGDLIFWREVADYIDANGGASAMAGIADTLDDADVTISNLESPLSDDDSEPVPDKDIYIIGRPQAIEGMRNSGIDIVSLANNHIMDYTGPALQDTLAALDREGILHAGAGMNEEQADAMVETNVNGASIAFFSWTDIVPDYYVAYGDQPGVASARLNMEDALRRVREAKETHDIVIVSMHWGVEYQDYIDDSLQRTPAHQLVDAGADVVLGNHPHVPEGIEFYKGSLIAYAHGNCVFRQSFDFGNTHESYVLHFTITQDGIQDATVVPLYLSDDYGIPSIAQGEQAQSQLEHLEQISDGMNTAFNIQDGVARISPAK